MVLDVGPEGFLEALLIYVTYNEMYHIPVCEYLVYKHYFIDLIEKMNKHQVVNILC